MANNTTTTKRPRKNSFGTLNGCEAHNVADCARCARTFKANPIAPRVEIDPETPEAEYTPAQRAASYLQTMPTDVLTAMVRGDVNALAIILDELGNRGLDPVSGKWIGFPRAAAAVLEAKESLNVRELPRTRITPEGVVEHLTNNPTTGRLVYVTVPK